MSKIRLEKFFKFIRSKWNIIVTVISIIGVLVFNFIPQTNDNIFKIFIFLGINAIVWTLIEIKLKLDEKKPSITERFDDRRHARPHIVEHIYQCMKTNKSGELCIEIIGRSIKMTGDIMSEIKNTIVRKEIITRNIKFKIYAMNPELVRNSSTIQSNNRIKERIEGYASAIELAKKSLLSYNELNEFKESNIIVEVEFYDTLPIFYSFKIGNEHIYLAFYTWDNSKKEFSVTGSPCYYLEKKHANFNDYFKILSNITEFYQSCKMK